MAAYFLVEDLLNGRMLNIKSGTSTKALKGKQIIVQGELLSLAAAMNPVNSNDMRFTRCIVRALHDLCHTSGDQTTRIFFVVSRKLRLALDKDPSIRATKSSVTVVDGGVEKCRRDLTDPKSAHGAVEDSSILIFAAPGEYSFRVLPPESLLTLLAMHDHNAKKEFGKPKDVIDTRDDENGNQENMATSNFPASWWS